jgi:S2P endopeptidase
LGLVAGARSAAIALVNMAPVYYLDGDAALEAALELLRPQAEVLHVTHMGTPGKRRDADAVWLTRRKAVLLHRWILRVGTAVFVTVFVAHVIRVSALDAPLTLWLRRLHGAIKFVFRGRD